MIDPKIVKFPKITVILRGYNYDQVHAVVKNMVGSKLGAIEVAMNTPGASETIKKIADEYLKAITKEVTIPVLRKDFTIDPYMIYQAKVFGASAILLIAAILSDEELKSFYEIADTLGMSCLFEAHDEEEVERCLTAGTRIVGVNNRNLKDFTVDINNSIRLRELVPENIIFVSESGIMVPEDVKALRKNGTDAVLIGEMLMRSDSKSELIKSLKN